MQQPSAIKPLQVVLICITLVTLSTGYLLLSAEDRGAVDGSIEWHAESLLRAVVQLLCLNFEHATDHPGDVKNLILGLGTGIALLAVGVAALVGTHEQHGLESPASDSTEVANRSSIRADRLHLSPVTAAQYLLVLLVLWSFVSSRWSHAPLLSLFASMMFAIFACWALVLGLGLTSRAAALISSGWIAITVITSLVALWYYYGRNPTLRAKFPFGNPIFLATCLVPGLMLALSLLQQSIRTTVSARSLRALPVALAAVAAALLIVWVLRLAGSRGVWLGVGSGIAVMLIALLPRWYKCIPLALVLLAIPIGVARFNQSISAASPTGRDATLRVRLYGWKFAGNMIREKPLIGHGQGGFALKGDSYAANHVLVDPQPFQYRIAHAHSEWLETAADLGLIGFAMLLAVLTLSVYGAWRHMYQPHAGTATWLVAGLLAAFVAMMVTESTSTGLRVSGVPVAFFTTLGLLWSVGRARGSALDQITRRRGGRVLTSSLAAVAGIACLALSLQDFAAARSAYTAVRKIERGEFEQALQYSMNGQARLSPQRAIANLMTSVQAAIGLAEQSFQLAVQRGSRANQSDNSDPRLKALEAKALEECRAYCAYASAALGQLIRFSPGYIDHGVMESVINWLQANIEPNPEKAKRFMDAAVAGIERELLRQPFSVDVAVRRAGLPFQDTQIPQIIETLARPFRYQRITPAANEMIALLTSDQTFDDFLESAAKQAIASINAADRPGNRPESKWAPETLRLAATAQYLRGDYRKAVEYLRTAVAAYRQMQPPPALANAACLAELAECMFSADPLAPHEAVAVALEALADSPPSFEGRSLQQLIHLRLVDFRLAAGDESGAIEALRRTGPVGVSTEAVLHELGGRYRKLCEFMLARREAGVLRKPPQSLTPSLVRWMNRSLELRPSDARSHYVAADVFWHNGDEARACASLTEALRLGFPPEAILEFIRVATSERPDSNAMRELKEQLTAPGSDAEHPAVQDPEG